MLNIIDKVYNSNRSVKKLILIVLDLSFLFVSFLTSLFVKVDNFKIIFISKIYIQFFVFTCNNFIIYLRSNLYNGGKIYHN